MCLTEGMEHHHIGRLNIRSICDKVSIKVSQTIMLLFIALLSRKTCVETRTPLDSLQVC